MMMFSGYIRDFLVDYAGDYIEDFTADDINIDSWQGKIIKEHVELKKSALSWLTSLGMPISIERGFIGKLEVDFSLIKIQSTPLRITLKDIHIVARSKGEYASAMHKLADLSTKKGKLEQLIKEWKKKLEQEKEKREPKEATYLQKLGKIIVSNLIVEVEDIHIRFEDSRLSRSDQNFNFGVLVDRIAYSGTNSKYQRTFRTLEEQQQEKRSFNMIEIVQICAYWNSGLQNWTDNEDIQALKAKDMIKYSRDYCEQLKRRYASEQSNQFNQTVFILKPLDIKWKLRYDLTKEGPSTIPGSTSSFEIGPISLSIDEGVYQDIQFLSKFIAWHSQREKHFKYRPAFNQRCDSSENARLWWKYAIKSICYMNKKPDQQVHEAKRAYQTLKLAELYTYQQTYDALALRGVKQPILSSEDLGEEAKIRGLRFENKKHLQDVVKKIEHKLTPQMMFQAYQGAYLRAKKHVARTQTTWSEWLLGKEENKEENEFDLAMRDSDDLVQSHNKKNKYFPNPIIDQFILQIPQIEVNFVSKLQQRAQVQNFMKIRVFDFRLQTLLDDQKVSSTIYYVKNIDIVDTDASSHRFSKVLWKKEMAEDNVIGILQENMKKPVKKSVQFRAEVEEEDTGTQNNGLPLVFQYDEFFDLSRTPKSKQPFFIARINSYKNEQNENVEDMKFFLNSIQVFYNRRLISKFETFFSLSKIKAKTHTSAGAELDARMERIKKNTRAQFNKILNNSKIHLVATIKSIELVLPDHQNYETSKFLVAQVGTIVVDKKADIENVAFSRPQIQELVKFKQDEVLENEKSAIFDRYQLNIFDIRLLYIASTHNLDNIQLLDKAAEIEADRSAILNKFNIEVQLDRLQNKEDFPPHYPRVKIGVVFSRIEARVSHTELRYLKNFAIESVKYHQEIARQVKEETKTNFSIKQFEKKFAFLDTIQAPLQAVAQRVNPFAKPSQEEESKQENKLQSQISDDSDEFEDAIDAGDEAAKEILNVEEKFKEEIEEEKQVKPKGPKKIMPLVFSVKLQKVEVNIDEEMFISAYQFRAKKFSLEESEENKKQQVTRPFLKFATNELEASYAQFKDGKKFAGFKLKSLGMEHFESSTVSLILFKSSNYEPAVRPKHLMDPEQEDLIMDSPENARLRQEQINFDPENEEEYFLACQTLIKDKRLDSEVKIKQLQFNFMESILTKVNDLILPTFINMDFGSGQEEQNQSQIKPREIKEPSEELKVSLNLQFTGLEVTLKVKKSVYQLLIAGFSLSLSKKGHTELQAQLDKISLNLNNSEIIQKLSTSEGGQKLIEFYLLDNNQYLKIETSLDKLFVTVEAQTLLQIVIDAQHVQDWLKIFDQTLPKAKDKKKKLINKKSSIVSESELIEKEVSIALGLKHLYFHLPLKESSNSFYLHFKHFQANFQQKQKLNQITSTLDKFDLYAAKSFDQQTRYSCLQIIEVSALLTALEQAQNLQLGCKSINIGVNENFVMLSASTLEQSFSPIQQVVEMLVKKKEVKVQKQANRTVKFQDDKVQEEEKNEEVKEVEDNQEKIEKKEVEETLFLSSTSKREMDPEDVKEFLGKVNDLIDLTGIHKVLKMQITLGKLDISWIFEMNFDDHEENYVTLHNKEISKQLLEEFDKQAELKRVAGSLKSSNNESEEASGFGSQEDFGAIEDKEDINQFNSIPQKQYKKLTLGVNGIAFTSSQLLYLHQDDFKFSSIEIQSIFLEHVTRIKNQVFPILQIIPKKESHAIQVLLTQKQTITADNLIIDVNQGNLQTLSLLAKDVYSCKNVFKEGQKRKLIKQLFAKKKASVNLLEPQAPQPRKFDILDITVILRKVKIQITDDEEEEDDEVGTHTTGGLFNMKRSLSQIFNQNEREEVKPNGLVLETDLKLHVTNQNLKRVLVQSSDEEENKEAEIPIQNLVLGVKNLQAYLQARDNSKVTILYPADLKFKLVDSYKQGKEISKGLLELQIIETEISVRSIFYLQKLIQKQIQATSGLKNVFKRLSDYAQNRSLRLRRRRRRLEAALSYEQREAVKKNKKEIIFDFEAQINKCYLTLISDIPSPLSDLNLPLVSLEIKNPRLQLRAENKRLVMTTSIPLEIQYFNQKLNFYEPFLESTPMMLQVDNSADKGSQISFGSDKTLNLNLSIAFYKSMIQTAQIFQEEIKRSNEMQSSFRNESSPLKRNQSIFAAQYQFQIQNLTGETILFKTKKTPAFIEMQSEESHPLEFVDRKRRISENNNEESGFIDISSENENSTQEDLSDLELENFGISKPVSPYRKEKFRLLKNEPKNVSLQILLAAGTLNSHKTSVFEVNFDTLSTQKIFLDETKRLYVICQAISKGSTKTLCVKSPIQLFNQLKIPMELKLNNREINSMEDEGFSRYAQSFSVIMKPESSIQLPLKSCFFDQTICRPVNSLERSKSGFEDSTTGAAEDKYDWTDSAYLSLMQDERAIFETKPVVMRSRDKGKSTMNRKNNSIYFVLIPSVYSIRSFLDFNTQQTEYISLRYLTISPPFQLQNLIPSPLTLFFKDIERSSTYKQGVYDQIDSQLYDLNLKMDSSLQVLNLDPQSNFNFALSMLGFDRTEYIKFKIEQDQDFQLMEDKAQEAYVDSMALGQNSNNSKKDFEKLAENTQFRFLRQKKLLFQLTSKFRTQFNICTNVTFINGIYHVCFYAKYWLLNNTQMPLQIRIKTKDYSFEKLDLPFENLDFDFETLRQLQEKEEEEEDGKDGKKKKRRNSFESVVTETVVNEGMAGGYVKSSTEGANERETEKLRFEALMAESQGEVQRMKPWEAYKIYQRHNEGLTACLEHEDLNKVASLYYNEDEEDELNSQQANKAEEEESKHNSKISDPPMMMVVEEEEKKTKRDFLKVEQPHKATSFVSKTSMSLFHIYRQLENEKSVPLITNQAIDHNLYEAPLKDKADLQRVILFSDFPQEEQLESEDICLRICDSKESQASFDLQKLQNYPIQIEDKKRKNHVSCLYELVTNVSYLNYPFSVSKLIIFQPRFKIQNKSNYILNLVQYQSEDKGVFNVFPYETSVFHWTDAKKKTLICLKMGDFEYSGPFEIDSIGEVTLRLNSTFEPEPLIVQVSITEQKGSLFVIVSNISHSPPYRIENLTKACFLIRQKDARIEDFDMLRPHQLKAFAWSYPQKEKLLEVVVCTNSGNLELGKFNIDSIKQKERIFAGDKKQKFVLEIINEKTIKVIRFLYQNQVAHQNEQEKEVAKNDKNSVKLKLRLTSIGVSIVNSSAREVSYIFASGLTVTYEMTRGHRKLLFRIDDLQVDNQLVRQNDAIILKRELGSQMPFLTFKVSFVKNESLQNLLYFKLFYLSLTPFDLILDGNFCDELYKYLWDLLQAGKKLKNAQTTESIDELGEIEQMKQTLKGVKTFESKVNQNTKIFFESFYIHDLKINFSFVSSPILFREFSMNPTLKFFIVLLSNMKNVQLKFSKYDITNKHLLTSIFLSQLSNHYITQTYSHKQVLKIVSSMDMFGNLALRIEELQEAFYQLINQPFQRQNVLYGLGNGLLGFTKHTAKASIGLVTSIGGTFASALVSAVSLRSDSLEGKEEDEVDVFDNDIQLMNKEVNQITSPFGSIDTQNRIWLKLITREKVNYDARKQKIQQTNSQMNQQKLIKKQQQNQKQSLGLTLAKMSFISQYLGFQETTGLERNLPQKKRPPRFVSFSQELEPYNYRKAFSLEVLNDINLNVLESESIQKLFQLNKNTLIFTGKRIICVTEYKSKEQREYRHWNMFYRDVIKTQVRIIDQGQGGKLLAGEELQEILEDPHQQQVGSLLISLLIIYHSGSHNYSGERGDKVDYSARLGGGMALSAFGDLRFAEREVSCKIKDFKLLKKIYKQLEKRTANSNQM